MDLFQERLQALLHAHSDPSRAVQMKAYMRDQFEFYGVMAGPRKELLRQTIRELGIPANGVVVVRSLFSHPMRELNHCGQELMLRCKKQWVPQTIDDLQWMVQTRSWWDTVDYIASNLVGELVKRYPEPALIERIQRWADSSDKWLIRTSILYQLKYRDRTDLDWLGAVILKHRSDKEFFIKKAIGWALREYAKTDEEWVRNFVGKHRLQPLSEREALKNFT